MSVGLPSFPHVYEGGGDPGGDPRDNPEVKSDLKKNPFQDLEGVLFI